MVDPITFENDVRSICRHLWPEAANQGAEMAVADEPDGTQKHRERDGIFRTSETIHLVEATTTRNLALSKTKVEKLANLASTMRRDERAEDKNIQVWLVLSEEPTGDQGSLRNDKKIRGKAKCPIHIVSIKTLFSKLVDASDYLRKRSNYYFGSARVLGPDVTNIDKYVPLDFKDRENNIINFKQASDRIISDQVRGAVIVGDFGSGKSMTLRQQYKIAEGRYDRGESNRFPVYLNLVDHYGQRATGEALLRHCDQIGFRNSHGLIGAWRAGYIDLYLDGFDELYSTKFVLTAKRMRQARSTSVELVRKFVSETPREAIVIIAGRQSYFGEDHEELSSSLGTNEKFLYLSIVDFSEEQVKAYLDNTNTGLIVPTWLPTRPLLLGYLLARRILSGTELSRFPTAAEGWDYLLTKIAEREAEQSPGGISDGPSVRRYLERLAWEARAAPSGRGPLSIDALRRVFSEVFGFEMDTDAEQFVFRLCGLTASSTDPEAREFFDIDFTDACAASNVSRYIFSPFENDALAHLRGRVHLGEVGLDIASAQCRSKGVSEKAFEAILQRSLDNSVDGYLLFDLVQIKMSIFGSITVPLSVEDIDISNFVCLANQDSSGLTFKACVFDHVGIEVDNNSFGYPKFKSCIVALLSGRNSATSCPADMFDTGCDISAFYDAYETNAQTLRSGLGIEKAILVTVLRKLFIQRGRGRKENAFYRGVEPRHRSLVKEALDFVARENFAAPSGMAGSDKVYLPNYSKSSLAISIINDPHSYREYKI